MPTMNEVMQRRSELLARIAAQREQVAEIGARWKTPLAFADQALVVARFLRSNSVLVTGAVALLPIRRSAMLLGLVNGVWRVWKGYRSCRNSTVKQSPRL